MSYLIQRIVKAFVNDNTNAPDIFRSVTVDEVPEQIGTLTGLNIYGYNIYNPNTVAVFVKIYSSAASPVVGTAAITETIQVPAGASVVLKGTDVLFALASKGWVAATTGYLDTDVVAPATDIICEITHK